MSNQTTLIVINNHGFAGKLTVYENALEPRLEAIIEKAYAVYSVTDAKWLSSSDVTNIYLPYFKIEVVLTESGELLAKGRGINFFDYKGDYSSSCFSKPVQPRVASNKVSEYRLLKKKSGELVLQGAFAWTEGLTLKRIQANAEPVNTRSSSEYSEVKQEPVMDYERLNALREGEQNKAEDDYFNARPENDTTTLRKMFCNGFERGFHKGLKYAAPVEPVKQEPVAWSCNLCGIKTPHEHISAGVIKRIELTTETK